MVDTKITRSEVVVVDEASNNAYGDLVFTDKGGNTHKVGNKRVQFFTDVIIPGKAVQLNYAVAYEKEYIYNAKLVEGELTEPTAPPTSQVVKEHMPPQTTQRPAPMDENKMRQYSIETQSSMKMITEIWVAGKIKDDDPMVTGLINYLGKYSAHYLDS